MPAMTDSEDEYEDYDPNAWKERYKKFMESKPKVRSEEHTSELQSH